MKTHLIASALLAGALGASMLTAPALAYEQKPKWSSSETRKNNYTHERVQRQQVRQTRRSGPFKPIFHPLTNAWNKVTR